MYSEAIQDILNAQTKITVVSVNIIPSDLVLLWKRL